MKDGPSFQLFAQDFFMDTVEWTAEEVGIYWRLLQAEWVNGSLPDDQGRLARIAGISTKKFPKRWQVIQIKFIQNGDGRLINQRLEETREAQREYREGQAAAGRRSVEAKRKRGIFPFSKSNAGLNNLSNDPSNQNQTLQSSSSIKEKKINKRKELDYSQLQKRTDKICKTLSTYFKRFNFYAWRQEQVNKQQHPEAIEECLNLLWEHRATVKKGPRPYLAQLIKIKGPNPFEREGITEHQKRKREELGYDKDVF